MVRYILNGVDLPGFPTVDSSIYQFAVVIDISSTKTEDFNFDYELIFVSTVPVYGSFLFNGVYVDTIAFESASSFIGYACKKDSISWSKISLTPPEGNTATYLFIEGSSYVWTSHDIENINTGNVQHAGSDPTIVVFADTPRCSVNFNPDTPKTYQVGNIADTLRVSALISDTGVLTYQWYTITEDGDVAIDGSVLNVYTPATNVPGTYKYYCVVTNTYDGFEAATTTDVATIIIVEVDRIIKRLDMQCASIGWVVGKIIQYIIHMDSDADDATVINGVLHIFDGDSSYSDNHLEVT